MLSLLESLDPSFPFFFFRARNRIIHSERKKCQSIIFACTHLPFSPSLSLLPVNYRAIVRPQPKLKLATTKTDLRKKKKKTKEREKIAK